MKFTTLDNIFNYLPPAFRAEINDDDQIKSWAFQFKRQVPNLVYVSFKIYPINNHRINYPPDYERITGVYYSDKTECPVEVDTWCPMHKSAVIEPCLTGECHYTYNTDTGSIYTNAKDGYALVEYEAAYTKDGEFLVPDTPYELWQAMSHHVMSQYYLNKSAGMPSMYQLHQNHALQARNFMLSAKNYLAIQSINWNQMGYILSRPTLTLDERSSYQY
jgi:hypothetical protein